MIYHKMEKEPTYTNTLPVFGYIGDSLRYKAPQLLEDLAGKTILDIGCGLGSATIHLMKQHSDSLTRYIHIDANAFAFDEEDRRAFLGDKAYDRSRDTRVVADVLTLPLPDSSVDIVHYCMMFADNDELEGQTLEAFKEIDRVLKRGGLIIEVGGGPLNDPLFPYIEREGFMEPNDRDYVVALHDMVKSYDVRKLVQLTLGRKPGRKK